MLKDETLFVNYFSSDKLWYTFVGGTNTLAKWYVAHNINKKRLNKKYMLKDETLLVLSSNTFVKWYLVHPAPMCHIMRLLYKITLHKILILNKVQSLWCKDNLYVRWIFVK